jgi:hypothetical protein
MKKAICTSLILICILGQFSIADVPSEQTQGEYRLGAYDTIEMAVLNHPELSVKQTLTPDGQASLPLVGVVSAQGLTLGGFQRFLTDSYSMYIEKPQIVINLTPKPIYIVQYDLKKDTWEVKHAVSIDEAMAYAALDPTFTVERGSVFRVSVSKKSDFLEDNWYKIITATAVVVGVYATLYK